MFKIKVQSPVFDATYRRLLYGDTERDQKGVPDGTFYFKGDVVVPFSPRLTTFSLTTDNPNVPVNAILTNINVSAPAQKNFQSRQQTFVPAAITGISGTTTALFQMNVGLGRNVLQVTELAPNGRTTSLIINSTNYASFLQGYAREIFNNSQVFLDNQTNAIFNDYSTRLVDSLLDFQELLPESQALQILANKFAIRSLIHQPGSQQGTTDWITALTQSTPVFQGSRNQFEFEPIIRTLYNTQEDFSGSLAHVWLPNLAVTQWLAFVQLMKNLEQFTILKVTEDIVVFERDGVIQTHVFSSDLVGASSITFGAVEECFTSIRVAISLINSNTIINIPAAAYPFDNIVDECSTIGDERVSFDLPCDRPFDLGLPFDSDFTDPLSDGWVGTSMVGRLENTPHYTAYLDSFVNASPTYIGPVSYPYGFYTQQLNTNWAEVVVNVI